RAKPSLAPGVPGGPVVPVAPVAPVSPVAPAAPLGPLGPVGPAAPVGPVCPRSSAAWSPSTMSALRWATAVADETVKGAALAAVWKDAAGPVAVFRARIVGTLPWLIACSAEPDVERNWPPRPELDWPETPAPLADVPRVPVPLLELE